MRAPTFTTLLLALAAQFVTAKTTTTATNILKSKEALIGAGTTILTAGALTTGLIIAKHKQKRIVEEKKRPANAQIQKRLAQEQERHAQEEKERREFGPLLEKFETALASPNPIIRLTDEDFQVQLYDRRVSRIRELLIDKTVEVVITDIDDTITTQKVVMPMMELFHGVSVILTSDEKVVMKATAVQQWKNHRPTPLQTVNMDIGHSLSLSNGYKGICLPLSTDIRIGNYDVQQFRNAMGMHPILQWCTITAVKKKGKWVQASDNESLDFIIKFPGNSNEDVLADVGDAYHLYTEEIYVKNDHLTRFVMRKERQNIAGLVARCLKTTRYTKWFDNDTNEESRNGLRCKSFPNPTEAVYQNLIKQMERAVISDDAYGNLEIRASDIDYLDRFTPQQRDSMKSYAAHIRGLKIPTIGDEEEKRNKVRGLMELLSLGNEAVSLNLDVGNPWILEEAARSQILFNERRYRWLSLPEIHLHDFAYPAETGVLNKKKVLRAPWAIKYIVGDYDDVRIENSMKKGCTIIELAWLKGKDPKKAWEYLEDGIKFVFNPRSMGPLPDDKMKVMQFHLSVQDGGDAWIFLLSTSKYPFGSQDDYEAVAPCTYDGNGEVECSFDPSQD